MTSLVMSEVFGPTVQGEGPAAGRRAVFVRLGGCNLTCAWCDTAYTWDATRFDLRAELDRLPVDQVLGNVTARDASLVVISGGEPLLQDRPGYGLPDLAAGLAAARREVHVETNGTLAPSDGLAGAVALFVVSPKLAHAGMPASRTLRWEVLRGYAPLALAGHAVLKIVCRTVPDLAEAAAIADTAGFPLSAVWVMPEGTTTTAVVDGLQMLTDPAVALGMNVSGRQHVLTWRDERGH